MATHGPWTVNAKNRTVACALVNYANAPLCLINLVIYRRPTFSFPLLDFNPSTAFDGGGDVLGSTQYITLPASELDPYRARCYWLCRVLRSFHGQNRLALHQIPATGVGQ